MLKWLKKGTAALLAVSLMAGSALSAGAASLGKTEKQDLKIACISDTHYLSPDMIKDTADFAKHLNSDRKMFAESDAFLTAMLKTIKQDNPDVLVISGDLTKDGEKEGHEALAKKLGDFRDKEMPNLHIYVAPGNHDLQNSNAYNFNTADGVAVPAGRTTQQDFKDIYADLTYNDKTVVATFTPADGKLGGGLSYAARPKDGFTVISMDSARYSADNTDSGTDEHETSGAISAELESWILQQIKDAKKRGDTVIGVQHHGYIPHFGMEPDLLPMYLVNDYERLSAEFADAGMEYVFTGHMHANDIATMTTAKGNKLYDIETGSLVTYPSPSRIVTIGRTIEDGAVKEDINVKTNTGISTGDFVNPVTGETENIADITAYGEKHGFSNDMLSTTVNGFLHGYYAQIAHDGGIKVALEQLINDLLGDSLPMENITLEQLVDFGLPSLLPDGSGGEEIYFDSAENGIVVKKKVSIVTLNIVVPNEALKQTINVLLDKVDNEVLTQPEILDEVVGDLISDLTALSVGNGKTLLDYANYIYQSHLGGTDGGDKPLWVKQTTANLKNGTLLDNVIEAVFANLNKVIDKAAANIPFEDILGSKKWDNNAKVMVPLEEGRVPLIRPLDSKGATTLGLLFGMILGWPGADGGFVMPEKYTTKDALDKLLPLLGIDGLGSVIHDLLFGSPDSAGLISDDVKNELNTYLLSIVESMGTDANYPEDNNTVIKNSFRLSTNRTAFDNALKAAAEKDLTKYTKETADVLAAALKAAKELSPLCSQQELDDAAKALTDALAGLAALPATPAPDKKPPVKKPAVKRPAAVKKLTVKKKGKKVTLTIKKAASKNKTYIEYRRGKAKFKKLVLTAKKKYVKKLKAGRYTIRAYSYIKANGKVYKSKKAKTVKVTVK